MKESDLLEARNYRIYSLAALLNRIANDDVPLGMLYPDVFVEDEIPLYLAPFRRFSALHRFVVFIAARMFDAEVGELAFVPSLKREIPGAPLWRNEIYVLTVEQAFEVYDIDYYTFSDYRKNNGLAPLPSELARHLECEPDRGCECGGLPGLADECDDYWMGIRNSEFMADLLLRISEEVFFVLFGNRTFLAKFHRHLAACVKNYNEELSEEDPRVGLFTKSGVLRRASIPNWVQRAVEFRERGRCAECQLELGTLKAPIKRSQFDHMVPLAEGGLNDVTNIQLLCEDCNNKKSAKLMPPSRFYERWYRMPDLGELRREIEYPGALGGY